MSSSPQIPRPSTGHQSGTASPTSSNAIYHLAQEMSSEHGDDDDEQDMDYHPSADRSGIESFEDEDDGEEDTDDTLDDDPVLHNVHVEFSVRSDGSDNSETEQGDTQPTVSLTIAQLFDYFGAEGLRQFLQGHGLLRRRLNLDDEGSRSSQFRRRHRQRPLEELYPKIPSDMGKKLMASGTYGYNPYFIDRMKRRDKSLYTRLLWRELGSGPLGARRRASRAISQGLIPSTLAEKIIHYDARCYSGQFSDDGNFFYCCSQDFKVRMYDTSNPHDWKYYKTVEYPMGRWTITDATLSPDNRFLAYTSMRSIVCLATTDPASRSDPTLLDFSRRGRLAEGLAGWVGGSYFTIFSVRFSGDGRELVAGTSNQSVIVYDIETQQPVLRLQNHEEEVNAVCFGDQYSPHILYSGSDDTTLRVWDRRSMGDGREAGAFVGHTEGLTFVASRGDGRYVLSNAKDQTMKLWDIRKMMTTARFDTMNPSIYSTGYDYRYMQYPSDEYEPNPNDCSVVTFRGHKVLKTLIRCHFSPPESTNSRYVYTGSADGKVYIYNLDATVAGIIDVAKASKDTRPFDPWMRESSYHMAGVDPKWETCVRDASWHPSAPFIAATSWNGWDMTTGTCTLHSWDDDASDDEGDPPLNRNYNSRLEYVESLNRYADAQRDRSRVSVRSRAARAHTQTSSDAETAW
ncbi:hypothetical protein VTO42DRAFT_1673 [Malbranchea cinnamomea]